MPTKRIQLTEWLPDQPSFSTGLQDAKNVMPVLAGYAPFPLANDFSNAASENLNSVFVGKYGDTVQLFAGGATKLFKFDTSTLDLNNVSKAGGYGGISRWQFAQYGKVILAANGNSRIQSWTLNTSTGFLDVSVNAPIAKYVAVVRDFVVGAHLDGGTNADQLQWSNVNDETNWVSGNASQSDYQIISDGGNITGITGGEFGIVLLEKAIYRMSYVGSPLFFQFDAISRGLGCLNGNSVSQYAGITYFLADDGFYSTDGKSVTPIGAEKVDRYFFNNLNFNLIDSMSCTINPIKKLVIWSYVTVGGYNELLVYNIQLQKWSRVITDANYVGSLATTGTSLDQLGTLYPNIETIPASLDDRLWSGGKYVFAGTRGAKIVSFSGSNATAELVLTDIEDGYNSIVTLVRPIIDNGGATVSVASRRTLADNIVYSSAVSTGEGGRCSFRNAGRFHSIKITPTGNWYTAMSVDVDTQGQGNR